MEAFFHFFINMNLNTDAQARLRALVMSTWARLNAPQLEVRIWTWLAALLLALAWLQPHSYYPIPGFHKEAWVANWFAAALVILSLGRHQRAAWSPISCVFLALSLWVWIQFALDVYPSGGQALMISTTLLACGLLIEESRALQAKDPTLVLDVLMLSFGIAALVSVSILLVQLLQIQIGRSFDWFVWIINPQEGARPAANVGQPNHLATLLSFAMVAGLWALHRRLWGRVVLMLYVVLIAIGLGIVQSRSGLLQASWLVLVAFIWRRALGGRAVWMALTLALLLQAMTFALLSDVTQAILDSSSGRNLTALNEDAARLRIYGLAWEGVLAKPWLGWGIQELHFMQWHLATSDNAIGMYITLAHNLLLDLALWLGVPLALAVISVLGYCLIGAAKRTVTVPAVLSLMCVGAMLIHAMVELPHWLPSMLLPAIVLLGVLLHETSPKTIGLPWAGLRIFLASVVFLVASLSWFDYLRLEENFRNFRAEQNGLLRIPVEPPPTWVMHHLADNLRMTRMVGRSKTSEADLAWMESVVKSGPSYGVLFTYITSLALAGRAQEAELWMRRLDAVAPLDVRDSARTTWARYQKWYPKQLANFSWPQSPKHLMPAEKDGSRKE